MGCGASSSSDLRATPPAQLERSLVAASAADLHALLSSSDHASSLIVGVFGLRGCGKSTLLHSVRMHLSGGGGVAGSLPQSALPLPAPTQRFEVFLGPVPNDSHGTEMTSDRTEVLCVDTPGLPCGPSVRDAFSTLLPRLHRLLWVVDAAAEWSVDASITEMSKLWRECSAVHSDAGCATAAAAASSSSPSPRLAPPTLHVLLLHRSPADFASSSSSLTLAELLRRLRVLPEFAAEDWAHRLRAWGDDCDANRKEAVVRAVLGAAPMPTPDAAAAAASPAAASSSPSSAAPVAWATRRLSADVALSPPPPLLLPTDGARPLTAEPPSGKLTSPSGVHLVQAR